MDIERQKLLEQIKKWHEEDAFAAIIERLEPEIEKLDYELALELVRAYINLGNTLGTDSAAIVGDAGELYAQANALLDKFSLEGKDHATYLFYKGFALYKLGLINDAKIRLERAQRFVKLGAEDHLMPMLQKLLDLCALFDPDNMAPPLSAEDDAKLCAHIKQHFGPYRTLIKTDRYEILNVPPTPEHDFNLIITKGLSARQLEVPAGVDPLTDSRLELSMCLPAAWEFSNSEGYNIWPLNVLCDLINYILTTHNFVGFGYTFLQQKALHPSTEFSGGMLTALGAYPKQSNELVLSDGSYVHFFELVFLYPMELAFRESHSAHELLELFQQKHIAPSPVRKRADVCVQVAAHNSATKI